MRTGGQMVVEALVENGIDPCVLCAWRELFGGFGCVVRCLEPHPRDGLSPRRRRGEHG